MKCRVTSKELRKSGDVLCTGYANLATLLMFKRVFGYNAGVYGWNYDVYDFGRFYLTTGYRPIGRTIPYTLVDEYEEKARVVQNTYDYTQMQEKMELVYNEFLDRVTKWYEEE